MKKNCFLAHTLYYGAEKIDRPLYDRIKYVVSNVRRYKVCASTITDGDTYINSFQEGIGIILKGGDVQFCAHTDAGSHVENDGKIYWNDSSVRGFLKPDKDIIVDVIDNRIKYNEFRVLNYKPIGIFIRNQPNLNSKAILFNKDTVGDFYDKTKDLKLNYYYLTDGRLYKLAYNNKEFAFAGAIAISDLYS